jgi:hypothetical protein
MAGACNVVSTGSTTVIREDGFDRLNHRYSYSGFDRLNHREGDRRVQSRKSFLTRVGGGVRGEVRVRDVYGVCAGRGFRGLEGTRQYLVVVSGV